MILRWCGAEEKTNGITWRTFRYRPKWVSNTSMIPKVAWEKSLFKGWLLLGRAFVVLPPTTSVSGFINTISSRRSFPWSWVSRSSRNVRRPRAPVSALNIVISLPTVRSVCFEFLPATELAHQYKVWTTNLPEGTWQHGVGYLELLQLDNRAD